MYLIFAGDTPPVGGINDLKSATESFDTAMEAFSKLANSQAHDWAHVAKIGDGDGYQIISSYERGLS